MNSQLPPKFSYTDGVIVMEFRNEVSHDTKATEYSRRGMGDGKKLKIAERTRIHEPFQRGMGLLAMPNGAETSHSEPKRATKIESMADCGKLTSRRIARGYTQSR